MKFRVDPENSFMPDVNVKVSTFDGIIVNTTTLKALMESTNNGPIALVYDPKNDEIRVLHPYDC